MNLEIQALRAKVHQHYVTAVRQLAKAEYLSLTSEVKIEFHSKVSFLYESNHQFFKNIDLSHEVFCPKI